VELTAKDRIILPLDVSSVTEAKKLVDLLAPHVGLFKIGLEFIYTILASLIPPISAYRESYENLSEIRDLFERLKGRLFWDGKLCDIPNTVKGASIAISRMGVRMFNVHASCGEARQSVKTQTIDRWSKTNGFF